jgi:hypothetical protein
MAVVSMQTLCFAEVTKLPPQHRRTLQDTSRFHEIRTAAEIPSLVFSLCADRQGRLAEPGEKWQVTDLVTDSTLPTKRLIWAAISAEYYVVHYEQGGRGHSYHILIATFKQGDTMANVVWRGVGDKLLNFNAFLDALQSNRLDDRLDYYH